MHSTGGIGVYLRVSTNKQEVLGQIVEVKRWLTGHEIKHVRWFVDRCTGVTMKRPSFEKLQKAVFNGYIRTVVMYSIDRFSRTMIDGLIELDRWRKQNVRMVFVVDCLDLQGTDPLNEVFVKLAVSMRLAMAEHERERMRARVKAGVCAAKEKVKRAKALAAKRYSIEAIADELNETIPRVKRMLTCKGNTWWGGSAAGRQRGCTTKSDPEAAYTLRKAGKPFKEIAHILGIGTRTAQAYVARVQKERRQSAASP